MADSSSITTGVTITNDQLPTTPINSNGNSVSVIVSEPRDDDSSSSQTSPVEGSESLKSKRPSLSLPILRVEQLKEEGCSSPGSSTYNSEDSEFSDTDIINRLGEFVPPNEELAIKIAEQMDFYFSDGNILKDSFLLKHVRRNKEGYVNLKLITSFKKMKTLTRDYRVVGFSLRRHSKTLIVNEDGNKAKRREPLPDYDETKTSRTVLAINIPQESKLNMESISNLFKHCGEITMLQILKPGASTIPPDIKKHLSKHPEASTSVCAVLEFEKHEYAAKALAMSKPTDDEKTGMNVVMLAAGKAKTAGDDSESDSEFGKHKKRNKKKALRSAVLDKEREGLSSGSEGDFLMPKPRSRNSSFGSDNGRGGHQRALLSPNAAEKSWTSPNGNSISNQRRRSMPLPQSPLAEAPKNSPKASPKPSPKTSPRASPEMRRRANSGGLPATTPEPGSSPWVQRRMQANREMSPLAKNATGKRIETILRTPRGPEPGKGFYGGKGRGKPMLAGC